MLGEPKAVDGECGACLFLADNYGDNNATICCQLAPGHEGDHREQFAREGGLVTITWVADERRKCDHGCGQWRHLHERHDETVVCPKDADDHEFSDCAWCHPNDPPLTCNHCGKITYYEEGHLRYCAKKPYACETCGESGVGNHDWPTGCPNAREVLLARGVADAVMEDQ